MSVIVLLIERITDAIRRFYMYLNSLDVCYDCNTKSTPYLWSQLQTSLPQLCYITNAIVHGLCIGIPSSVQYIPDHYPHPSLSFDPYYSSIPVLLRSHPYTLLIIYICITSCMIEPVQISTKLSSS